MVSSEGTTRLQALEQLDALDAEAGERVVRRLLGGDPFSVPVHLARVVAARASSDTPLETAHRWAWYPDDDVRRRFISLLGRLDTDSVDVLLRIIEAADPDVDEVSMIHAARALGSLADSTIVPRLRQARPSKRAHRRTQRAIDEAIASLAADIPRGALSGVEASGGELSSSEDRGAS